MDIALRNLRNEHQAMLPSPFESQENVTFQHSGRHEDQLYSNTSVGSFESFIQQKVKLASAPPVSISPRYGSVRYGFLTVYRRLFSIVSTGNLIALCLILSRHRTATALVRAAAANLVICGLARLPYVTNGMYLVICALPRSTPLFLRRRAAKVSHYGGVHSGCGVAAFCWYICYVAVLTRDFSITDPPQRPSTAVLGLAYLVLVLLTAMILVAYPIFRFIKHDVFELTHRFSSWILTVLFWVAYLKAANDVSKAEGTSLGGYLVRDATFWFAIILTVSLISPWVTLRTVPVSPEYLSDHAIRLHFSYTTTKFSQGVGVSTHPLRDWHSFAGIPDPSGKGFSLVISKAGDWTSARIRNPPTQLWKRAVPAYGFGHAALLFRKVLIVVTGSGIGPCLSLLASDARPPSRVLWQTRNPRKTYGDKILNAVAELDPDAVIIDTDEYGRQDMMGISWSLLKEFEAEAVFVISKPNLVRKIVYGFEARGVPAYGPLFDS